MAKQQVQELTAKQEAAEYIARRVRDAEKALRTVDDNFVRDLLANLMHWCAARPDVDFDDELRIARDNFQAEVMEAEG